MKEPNLRNSRLVLAGGIAAILVIGGGGFVLGRGTSEREVHPSEHAPIAAPPLAYTPPPDQTDPLNRVLMRRDLIALASQAADAKAAGKGVPTVVANAAGRRFEIRIPFGCRGPVGEQSLSSMRWRYDPPSNALRLHVAPTVWRTKDWWPDAVLDNIEAVEGFWIAEPWTASETCPPPGDRPIAPRSEAMPPEHTLALAQFFDADGARQGRRGDKSYEAVVRVAADEVRAENGFRFRISGRLANVPAGNSVSCRQPAGREQRPVCLIGMVADEVAIENPVTRDTLAIWTVEHGSPSTP